MDAKTRTELESIIMEIVGISKELDEISHDIETNTEYKICVGEIENISVKLRALQIILSRIL